MTKSKSIFEQLNLSNYKSYDSIPPAKKAWITIKAKQQGKDPNKVHSDIEKKMGGSNYTPTKNKITKKKTTTKVVKKQQSIFEQLNLSDYNSYDSIPPAKRAWITIKAKQQGMDPDKVHSEIIKKMGGSKTVKSKINRAKIDKEVDRKIPVKVKYLGRKRVENHILDVYEYARKVSITKSPAFEEKGLAQYAVNVGLTCSHSCYYCSSRAIHRTHPFFKNIGKTSFIRGYADVDPDTPIRVAKKAMSIKMNDRGIIELSTLSDAWCPLSQQYDIGRRCLEAILQEPKWQVRILTKNKAVANDFDVVKQYRDRVLVGLTLTGTPDKSDILSVIEPNASLITERMEVMKQAHKKGFRTYGMLCPLLPGIADSPKQIDDLVQFCEQVGAEEIFSEAVNARGFGDSVAVALRKAGYTKEADACAKISKKEEWSAYAVELIENVQKSMRKYSSIKKLRFLLYSDKLLPEHKKEIQKDDAGIKWL